MPGLLYNYKLLVTFAFLLLISSSCVSVKPYEKVYLNDSEMELGLKNEELYGESVHTYREGASGGTGGKIGGGCGCN